tara:strand:+ start:390 stop:1736 length:1347 start_codon:yes stop_codon:yes gene_type:complete
MGITLQIKRTTGTNAPGTLANGELAYSHGAATQGNNGKRLFVGDASNSVTVIGGQYFTDMLDHPLGTLTGSSAIITDATSKVDTIKLKGANNTTPGNIVLDDNDGSHATTLKGAATLSGNIDISLPTTAGTVITTGNLNNITSVGTLTSLTVDNVLIGSADAQTISTSSGNLKLDPAGVIDANLNVIENLGTPTQPHHATRKDYVDGLLQGLDVKQSVRVATTTSDANNSLSTAYANGQTLDGVSLVTGDRVLIKDHATGTENGVYKVNASGAPTREPDFDSSADVTAGAFVFVEEGSNADQGFVLTNNGTVTIGSTSLTFAQFSGAGTIGAGNGLSKTGSTLNVGGTANRISIGADTIDIDANYAGQTSITTLGTISSGTWQGTAIAATKGGTGLTTIAKGSLLVANTADTITALDGGASNNDDKVLLYTGSSDTLGFTSSLDGGTF